MTTLFSTSVRAGTWLLSAAGSGSASAARPAWTHGAPDVAAAWTPPSSGTNSINIPQYGISSSYDVSATATLSVTVTATWQPNVNLPSDPAPSSVWLCEVTSARWIGSAGDSGAASDGLGPEYRTTTYPFGASASTYDAPLSTPPAYWHSYPASGGIVTLPTRTLSASASCSGYYGDNLSAQLGPYLVSVHAQPYNWHQTFGQDNHDGTISFKYAWFSTSGNVPDLTDCYSHERVTYPGGSPYYPPLPFLIPSPGLPNPTVSPGTLRNGIAMTSTTTNGDTHYVWAMSTNYSDFTSLTVSATQRYEFDDVATGETNVLVPGPDSTPTITRIIYPVGIPPSLADWWYSVTKNGVSSTKEVMPHP